MIFQVYQKSATAQQHLINTIAHLRDMTVDDNSITPAEASPIIKILEDIGRSSANCCRQREDVLAAGTRCIYTDWDGCDRALGYHILRCATTEHILARLPHFVDLVGCSEQTLQTYLATDYRKSRKAIHFLLEIGFPLLHIREMETAVNLAAHCTLADIFISGVQFQRLRSHYVLRHVFRDPSVYPATPGLAVLQCLLLRAAWAWERTKTDLIRSLDHRLPRVLQRPRTLRDRSMATVLRCLGRKPGKLMDLVEQLPVPPGIKKMLSFRDCEAWSEEAMRRSVNSQALLPVDLWIKKHWSEGALLVHN